MVAVRRARHKTLFIFSPNFLFFHHFRHRILAHRLALGLENRAHARAAIDAAMFLMHGPNLDRQFLMPPPPLADLTFEPGKKSAATDLQNPADHAGRPQTPVLLDEGELHDGSLAKNAAAFLKSPVP